MPKQNQKMTTWRLAQQVAKRQCLPPESVFNCYECLVKEIAATLLSGGVVVLTGFATLSIGNRKGRAYYHPSKRKLIQTKKRKFVRIKASNKFEEKL